MKKVLRRCQLGLMLLFLSVLAGCSDDYTEVEIPLGYKGAARVNPFLAMERFLQEMGMEAKQHSELTELPDYDTVLFLPSEAIATTQSAQRIRLWVENGGHLIYLHQGGDSISNDFAEDIREKIEEAEEAMGKGMDEDDAEADSDDAEAKPKEDGEDKEKKDRAALAEEEKEKFPMLAELNVRLRKRPRFDDTIQIQKSRMEVEIPSGDGFKLPRWVETQNSSIKAGQRNACAFASFDMGLGRVTLLSDARPWRNRYIGENDHAKLLWEIVNLDPDRMGAWLLRGTSVSFFQLLRSYAWMPLIGIAVYILFWLWKGIPRFGPMFPAPDPAQRDFLGHLSMTGNYLWQKRCQESLIDPVRHRILRRWHRKHILDADDAGPEVIATLAEASGLPEQRVRAALQTTKVKDANQLINILRDLQKLEQAK